LRNDPNEAGGLSGKPLFARSTIVLAKTRERAGPDLALIGAGGVDSAETALAKIEAGANLVQLYTGMIYRGPGIANAINRGLSAYLDRNKYVGLAALIGTKAKEWAKRPIPA
jgi:dihydroorotate dehydrogenase